MNPYASYLSKLYRPPLKKRGRSDFHWLDRNEAPFPAFSNLSEFIDDVDIEDLLRVYPDPYHAYVSVAQHYGVELNQLLLTHGSEQALRFIFDTFLEEGGEVAYLQPSFGMYDVYAYYKKANVIRIAFGEDFHLPIQKIIDIVTPSTQLLVLANPNSPTGTAYSLDDIIQVVNHTANTGTVCVLDEAYYHYYSLDTRPLLQIYSNLIITRTFSKAWGLAGLRIGMILSNDVNIKLLRSQKLAMEINQFSILILKKAIECADVILERNIRHVEKWKEYFSQIELPDCKYLPGNCNFVLFRSSRYHARKRLFNDYKIATKQDFNEACLKDCIRITVGNDKAMEKVVNALSDPIIIR